MPNSQILAFKVERQKTVVLESILQGTWGPWGYAGPPWASQNRLKSRLGGPKIHPEALLEPILGQCLKEARF